MIFQQQLQQQQTITPNRNIQTYSLEKCQSQETGYAEENMLDSTTIATQDSFWYFIFILIWRVQPRHKHHTITFILKVSITTSVVKLRAFDHVVEGWTTSGLEHGVIGKNYIFSFFIFSFLYIYSIEYKKNKKISFNLPFSFFNFLYVFHLQYPISSNKLFFFFISQQHSSYSQIIFLKSSKWVHLHLYLHRCHLIPTIQVYNTFSFASTSNLWNVEDGRTKWNT